MMRRVLLGVGTAAVLLATMAQAPVSDPLARARQAYNSKQFDAAIAASKGALGDPTSSNVAAVVLARAHLERYRAGADSTDTADLDAARAALAQVRPGLLTAADRAEFLVGMGVSLFLDGCIDGCFSAAAEFFDLALEVSLTSNGTVREPMFEWWASALDRQAQYGADESGPTYRRILERAEAERAKDPDSTAAAYWVAASARGVGDLNRAWGAAIAGWMRAKYLGPRGEALRADLNEFVTEVLLPERAKQQIQDGDPRPVLEVMKKQWADLKEKYK